MKVSRRTNYDWIMLAVTDNAGVKLYMTWSRYKEKISNPKGVQIRHDILEAIVKAMNRTQVKGRLDHYLDRVTERLEKTDDWAQVPAILIACRLTAEVETPAMNLDAHRSGHEHDVPRPARNNQPGMGRIKGPLTPAHRSKLRSATTDRPGNWNGHVMPIEVLTKLGVPHEAL